MVCLAATYNDVHTNTSAMSEWYTSPEDQRKIASELFPGAKIPEVPNRCEFNMILLCANRDFKKLLDFVDIPGLELRVDSNYRYGRRHLRPTDRKDRSTEFRWVEFTPLYAWNVRPDDLLGEETGKYRLAGYELLWALIMFPKWIENLPEGIYVHACGYQAKSPISGKWTDVPYFRVGNAGIERKVLYLSNIHSSVRHSDSAISVSPAVKPIV